MRLLRRPGATSGGRDACGKFWKILLPRDECGARRPSALSKTRWFDLDGVWPLSSLAVPGSWPVARARRGGDSDGLHAGLCAPSGEGGTLALQGQDIGLCRCPVAAITKDRNASWILAPPRGLPLPGRGVLGREPRGPPGGPARGPGVPGATARSPWLARHSPSLLPPRSARPLTPAEAPLGEVLGWAPPPASPARVPGKGLAVPGPSCSSSAAPASGMPVPSRPSLGLGVGGSVEQEEQLGGLSGPRGSDWP